MYCVSSRYYVSEWGKFIQPIDPIGLNSTNINGLNLYGYGSNNPVKKAYKSKTNLKEGISYKVKDYLIDIKNSEKITRENFAYKCLSLEALPTLQNCISVTSTAFNIFNLFDAIHYMIKYSNNSNLAGWALREMSPFGKIANGLQTVNIFINGYNIYEDTGDFLFTLGSMVYDGLVLVASEKVGAKIAGSIGGPAGIVIGYLLGNEIQSILQSNKTEIMDFLEQTFDSICEWISSIWRDLING